MICHTLDFRMDLAHSRSAGVNSLVVMKSSQVLGTRIEFWLLEVGQKNSFQAAPPFCERQTARGKSDWGATSLCISRESSCTCPRETSISSTLRTLWCEWLREMRHDHIDVVTAGLGSLEWSNLFPVTTRFLSYTVPSLLGFLYSGGISFDPSKTTRSLYDSPEEDSFTCFMAKGPKVKTSRILW